MGKKGAAGGSPYGRASNNKKVLIVFVLVVCMYYLLGGSSVFFPTSSASSSAPAREGENGQSALKSQSKAVKGSPSYILEDESMRVEYIQDQSKQSLTMSKLVNKALDRTITIKLGTIFEITTSTQAFSSNECSLSRAVQDAKTQLSASFNCGSDITITLTAALVTSRYKSSYLQHTLKIKSDYNDVVEIEYLKMLNVDGADSSAYTHGTVDGSPAVDLKNGFFFGLLHPMSDNALFNGAIVCSLSTIPDIHPGDTIQYRAAIGSFASKKLLWRSFYDFIELSRSNSYHQLLHYNSWYDLRSNGKAPFHMDEETCLDRIRTIGSELYEKRQVTIDSFLIDDGWDNHDSLWEFNEAFPNKFSKIRKLADKYKFGIGVWLSPWGGYMPANMRRLKYGAKEGFEISEHNHGFSLAGPKYNKRFTGAVMEMLENQGVNLFKFDGIGAGLSAYGAHEYAADFSALLTLIYKIRSKKPNTFINLTIGTWPSPFWLMFCDSVWRGGLDFDVAGDGTYRAQWITYRDSQIHRNVVVRTDSLFPISNLMLHGIICGATGTSEVELDLCTKQYAADFEDEVWSFFASGTNLQELYITPSLLDQRAWDAIGDASKWARQNSHILLYSRWIGGDPLSAEIYGFASCDESKGIIMLRNPASVKKTYTLSFSDIFDILHVEEDTKYSIRKIYAPKREGEKLELEKDMSLSLSAFEVILFEVTV